MKKSLMFLNAQARLYRDYRSGMKDKLRIVIIAGPNGAGKTSFAKEYLPNEAGCPDFINADLIAAGLSPFKPETAAAHAGRIMLQEIMTRVKQRKSFAFETTLSGRSYAQKIPQWQALGYHVKLIFLNLPNVEMAIARVAARVAQGGHNIQTEVIRRRFNAGLHNFDNMYKNIVNEWILYDNSGSIPVLLDLGEKT